MRRIDLRGRLARGESLDYKKLVPRAEFDVEAALDEVRPTIADVRHRGVEALLEIASRDGVEITELRVPPGALASARDQLDPELRAAFEESIRRLRLVSETELERDQSVEVVPGGRVTSRLVPFQRVGVYVPAGVTALASTVLMNVVPAQVAGVDSIALASPAQAEYGGQPHPTVLAVCALLGIDEVYAIGGVGAVAMFTYGTEQCRRVDFVAGPGRITTVAAKRLVKGVVGIDSEAGPSEILVFADDTADPVYVATDLISEIEHAEQAAGVLVTPSQSLAEAVQRELDVLVPQTKHAGRIDAGLHGQQSGIVLVDDLEQGLEVVDAYASEHVEVLTADAATWAARIRNAGAIFIGPWSPVPLGDYCAGSNHVLPTGGCACHSSGLSARSFVKTVHVIEYDQAALREVAPHITAMADAEDLPAHGAAVQARFAKQHGFAGHPDGYA